MPDMAMEYGIENGLASSFGLLRISLMHFALLGHLNRHV
jgi:uncharacterized membrane protein YcjF (UPF0283 family)